MKKIVSTLLAAAMALSLSTTVFADDGTQSTALTVHVTPGTYTVSVPESLSVNAADIVEGLSGDSFYFGEESQRVSVSDVQNCRIVNCEVTAPTLAKEDGATLGSGLSVALINPNSNDRFYADYSDYLTAGKSHIFQLYQKGRTDNVLKGNLRFEEPAEYGQIRLAVSVSKSSLESADPGDYTGNVTFRFFSSNTLPATE